MEVKKMILFLVCILVVIIVSGLLYLGITRSDRPFLDKNGNEIVS